MVSKSKIKIRIRNRSTRWRKIMDEVVNELEEYLKTAVKRTKHYLKTPDETATKIMKKIRLIQGFSVTLKFSKLNFDTKISAEDFAVWLKSKIAKESYKRPSLHRLSEWFNQKLGGMDPETFRYVGGYVVKKHVFRWKSYKKTLNPKRDIVREFGRELYLSKSYGSSVSRFGKKTYQGVKKVTATRKYKIKVRIR